MPQPGTALQQRIATLRWILPALLGTLAVLYEIGPGRWIHDGNTSAYFDLDIVFFGLVLPLLTYLIFEVLRRWFAAKEHAEHEVQAMQQRLLAIMEASADAILSLDSTGHIQAWNRQVELLFAPDKTPIKGRSLAELMGHTPASEVELRWLLENVRLSGAIRGHETICLDARGREIAMELAATALTDGTRQTGEISVILHDITERRNREVEIRRLNSFLHEQVVDQTQALAQKLEELAHANLELRKLDQTRTEFVSVVAHQIRAPLTNMSGAMERMQGACLTMTSTCGRMFVIVREQTERLERLVKDVLNATRIEAGELSIQPEPISLPPLINQVIEQIHARRATRPIEIDTKPGLPLVFADRDRVAEVLANLLDNADKYSPPEQVIHVGIRATQSEVTLSVRDGGAGLRPQDLDRIFDKFYRADNSDSQRVYGYGLGLYICRKLVEAQKGHIWAENAPQGGAIFSFTLPAVN